MVASLFLPKSDDFGSLVQRLADEVQDVVVGALIWGAWPKCPHHEHQLVAKSDNGVANWVCPIAMEAISEVGTYTTDST
jgi:hypothetical protein